jgi:hypothetical protein
MPNQAGTFQSFNYQAVDGSRWTASLKQYTVDVGVSNPPFWHTGPNPADSDDHQDQNISYLTGNESKWTSNCQSHSSGLYPSTATFTFDHYQYGNTDLDHQSDYLQVLDWDGSMWNITVPEQGLNEADANAYLNLNIAPGPAVGTAPVALPPPVYPPLPPHNPTKPNPPAV